jgi:hypothetical protein
MNETDHINFCLAISLMVLATLFYSCSKSAEVKPKTVTKHQIIDTTKSPAAMSLTYNGTGKHAKLWNKILHFKIRCVKILKYRS